MIRDQLGRGIGDLRISVIDRCNHRCTFCMPAGRQYRFLPRRELLTYEEITRLARIFVALGARKIRLTGGEPLVRSEIERLVEMLAEIEGIEDLALTTNGRLLVGRAEALAEAGLDRVTVSVESLDEKTYGEMTGLGQPVGPVLEGIEAAARAGLGPIKVNTLVQRGVNDHQIVDLARYFKERGHVVRFIEYMDVGTLNEWREADVLSAREIIERIDRELPLEPLPRRDASDTALRFRYLDDGVEVGAIASVSEPFCGACTRARLSSEGSLFTCLFAATGLDLKHPLRAGADDCELEALIRERWAERADRYSEEREERMRIGGRPAEPRVEMYRIGG
ncbi:MAG TPA: GTP 3',8-cyclase MoaA [Thermoanaerobaculia bacterium]|nr:GTP 3',8-cyclase MoaA [Thermoanaerobaculia bacterium]